MASALAELRDIHLPPPVSWWPPAPGYFVLTTLCVIGLLLALFLRHTNRTRHIKRHALLQLKQLELDYQEHHNINQTAAQVSLILKQVALLYYPREQVASLHDKAWINFLTETSKNLNAKNIQNILLEAPFCLHSTHAAEPLFHFAKLWIKQQKRPICSS